jgi:hypothetical protein
LEFISDFGKPNAPLPAAIVACVPKKVHVDDIGETEFEIYPEEITEAIKAGLEEPIYPEPEVRWSVLMSLGFEVLLAPLLKTEIGYFQAA